MGDLDTVVITIAFFATTVGTRSISPRCPTRHPQLSDTHHMGIIGEVIG